MNRRGFFRSLIQGVVVTAAAIYVPSVLEAPKPLVTWEWWDGQRWLVLNRDGPSMTVQQLYEKVSIEMRALPAADFPMEAMDPRDLPLMENVWSLENAWSLA